MDEVIFIMYEELKRKLKIDKKLYKDSVILSLLNLKSNKRANYLIGSAFEIEAFRGKDSLYINQNLIKSTGMERRYCLTAKAVWDIEYEYLIENSLLTNFLDEKYFDSPDEMKSLSEKEKVIIFSLILGRAFSAESPMDLKLDRSFINRWEEIINKSYDILVENKSITKLKKADLFKENDTEHKVSNLVRHSDALPKKCKMLFKAPGRQKYYIDVAINNDDIIDADKLIFLLKVVFDDAASLTLEMTDKLATYCTTIAHDTGLYTNNKINTFISVKNDKIIKQCFEDLY